MHIVMGIMAAFLTFWYLYFYCKACLHVDRYENGDVGIDLFSQEINMPMIRLVWISYTVLGIVFFSVGCIMLQKLKRYFKDFYKHQGCRLWAANCALTFPLTFRAVFDALKVNEAWVDYWFSGGNTRAAVYNLIIITFATYLPTVMQMASLIFGFMRQRAGKLEISKKDDGKTNADKGLKSSGDEK